jgi:hypothetical protein
MKGKVFVFPILFYTFYNKKLNKNKQKELESVNINNFQGISLYEKQRNGVTDARENRFFKFVYLNDTRHKAKYGSVCL